MNAPDASQADCTCHAPGYCGHHGRHVTATGARVWAAGNARSIAAYFGDGTPRPRRAPRQLSPVESARAGGAPCAYLGGQATNADGSPRLRDCPSCRGTVRLKVRACRHPGHASDPTTTEKACKACPDYGLDVAPPGPASTAAPAPIPAGGDPVLNFWRGGSDAGI